MKHNMYIIFKQMSRNVTIPTHSNFWVGMFIVLLSFTQLQHLEAQTTWTGTTSTAWATTTNWSSGVVPTSTTDVVINSGTTFMPNISTTPIAIKSLTVNSGATLTLSASKLLTVAGLSGSGSIICSGGLTIGDANNASTQFDGVISGAGTITKVGTGTFIVTGTNTYTGTTTISAGTIKIGASAATMGNNSAITVTGTLDLGGNSLEVGSIAGAGTITSSAAGTIYLIAGANNTNTAFSGEIANGSGEVWLTKKGTGTLTLSGSNSYSGGTQLLAGTLSVATIANGGSNSNLGAADTNPGRLLLNGGSLTITGTTVTTDRGFQINDGTSTITVSGTTTTFSGSTTSSITTTATLIKAGAGTLVLSGGSANDAAITISAGTLKMGSNQGLGSTTGSTTISTGATLDLNGFSFDESIKMNGTGTIVNSNTSTETTLLSVTTTPANFGGAGTINVASIISGSSTLTKTGTGILALAGTNTYSGATTVSAGTLRMDNNAALGTTTATTISSGAIVDLNGFTTTELFTISGSLVNNSGTATVSGAITLTTAAIIGGTGNAIASGIISSTSTLTKTGTGTWTLSGVNTYTGTTTITEGTIKIGSSTATLGPITSSAITVTGTLDLNGNSLEVGSIAGAGTITSSVAGNITLTLGANNTTTTFSGILNDGSGQVALVKKGAGVLTLSGINTYSGATTISAGTVTMGNNAALGTVTGATTIASGTTLDLNGFTTAELITVSGSLVSSIGTATASGDITLTTAAIFGGTGSAVVSGIISGAGTLSKTGAGTWTLSGANTYSALTTVSVGTLKLGNNNALGGGSATTIASGAFVDLNGFATTELFTISGSLVNNSGTATASGNITLTTAAIIGGTNDATVSGIISGTGTLTKTGAGTWTLSGVNTYTAATTVSVGTLKLANNVALGTTTKTTIAAGAFVDLNGTTTTELFTISGSLVNNSGTATVSGAITLTTVAIIGGTGDAIASGIISSTGTLTKTGTGTWTLSGVNTYSGTTTVSAGTLKLGNIDALGTTVATTISLGGTVDVNGLTIAEPFTLSGSLVNTNGTASTITSAITLTTAAIIGGSGNVTASGVISSTGTLQKTGSGTWTLSGNNTFSGATTVTTGILKAGSNTAFGSTALTTISSGATVDLNGFVVAELFVISGSLVNNSANAATTSGTISLSTAAIIGGAGDVTASGIISGAGTLQKTGTNSWTLSGVNTFSGIATISAGTIKLGNAAGLGATTVTTAITIISADATVDLNGLTSAEPFTISGSLVNTSGTAATSSGAITLSNAAIFGGTGNVTVSGIISSTGSLTKIGTGTFTLSGVNTFTGGVTINAGTLSVATIGNGNIAGNLGQATNAAANLVLGGGQLTYTGATATTDRNITLTASTVSQINISTSGTTLTVSGATANTTGGFTKEGLGTLTFSGTNLHTGVTYKNAGTLNNGRGLTTVSAGQTMYVAVGQTITIPSGSTLTNNGTVQVEGTLTITGTFVNTGTISGTGTYIFNSTTAQTIPAALTYPTLTISNTAGVTLAGNVTTSGQLTLNASNTLQISGYNLSVNSLTGSGNISNSGSCALITVSGTTNTTYSGIISGCTGLTKSGSSTLTMSGTNTFTGATTIAGGVLSVATIGNGGVSGNMGAATNVASNLVLSGGTLSYTGATTTTDRNFTLYTGTSSTIEVTTGANTLTLNGVLSSSGGIAKTGAGTLTLTGTNTYTGATTINAGTLSVATIGNGGVSGNMGAATNASANLVLGGGTLLYTGATASTDRNFILTNGTTSTINISANTFTWNGASTSTSGAITKAGAGTLIWNGANAYTGLTTISAGIVQLGNTTALGTAAAGVSITSGAALDLNGLNISNAEATTINGTGVASSGVIYNSSTTPATYAGLLTLGSASTIIGGAASINFTNKGTITGAFGLTIRGDAGGTLAGILGISSGTLTKADAGTWLVSGANTYTGATTISAGVLKLGSASALGTTSGSTTLTSGAALDLNGQTYTTAEGLTINGTGISNGGAIMNTSTTTATYAGTLRLGSASSIVGETGAINFTSTGAITGAFALTLNGSLGGSLTSPLTTSTGTLTKEGIGTWKLGGASTYTGATTINNGVLKLGKSSTANNGPLGTSAGSTTINSGATLDFNGYSLSSSSVEPLIPFGNGYNGLGAIINSSSTASTFQGTINTTNGADFKIGGVGQITFSGVIAGNKNITKIGTNTVLFSATNNSYSGTTTISEGYLSVESIANEGVTTGRLGNSSAIFIDGGGLIYSGATATTNRVITLNASKNSTISVSTTASILTLSGVMTGGGSLIKAGTGTLELTAQNTYSGSTTIAAGTLKVANITDAGNGYNLGTGSDIIFSGGTLLYNGSTASTNRNFTLTTSTISTINVSTAGSILTMSGTGSGAGALKIANNATGTLELTGSNSYSGATTISTGILKINTIANGGVNSSIGAASNSAANLIFGTGTLLYTGSSASTDRNFTLGASKTTTFDIENSASTLTIAGSCGSTSGGVTKIGAGTLALTGTNKYTGVTTITAGTLSVSTLNNGGVAGGMGAATNAVGKLVFNGGTLAYTGNSASTNRSFTIGSDLQATIKVVNASTNLIWTGISNASTGGITKTGAGTLTLTGLNTYTGTSYINEGTVKLGAVKTNLKASSASTNINAGPLGTGGSSGELTMASGTVVAAGATLDYNGFSIGTIGYVYNSSSRPYPTYTGYRYYENITISGNGVGNVGAIINSSSKSITTNYTRTYLAADASIGGTGNYPLTYYSGTSTLTKKGNNTVTFNSVSTVTGNIIVEAGTLKYGASGNVLGGTGGSTTINSGATLDLNGYSSSIVEPLILNGTGYNGVGALYNSSTAASSIACTITLNTDVSIGGKGNITQSGTISGSGNLTKINANTLTLSATTTNTYTGTTTISGGNLSVTNFANLGNSDNSASNLVLNGGWLTYSGTTATMARSFTVADGTANTFNTIAASTNIITLTGSSTGGGSLTKAGTATLLVQGLLNHSGGTKDSTGVLELASSNGDALNNNGSFVFGGGTLKSKAGGDNETAGAINLTNSSTVTFGSTTVAHNLNFANSIANTFKDGKLISITNWVKSSRNGDSSFNSGAAGRFFVGDDKYGLTPQQRAKIRFTINTNITSIKYLTFPGVYSSGTTLKKFYSLSAEHLSTGELVPAVPRPILDIQGTDGYDTTCVSQTKTYNYTIYNIGDIDAANVTVRSDNANFVIGTKTGSTTVTAITTLIDGTSSTPGSSITFPVVFTPGSVSGTQTVKLITSSSTSRTDNDTLILEVFVATPPSFTSSTSGGACYDDQFATLNATGSSGSYISWHTGPTPTLGDTLSFGNTYIIDPLTATTTYYAQANLGSCVTTTGRTALTAILNIPSSDATIASSVTSICSNGTTNLSVTVNGGVSPYTLIYNDGTNDIMVPNYVSGTLIPVTVSRSTTFSITSLTDALGCDCEDISTNGSVSVDVNASVGGTPFADVASFCPGGATILTLYDYDGDTFQWQQSADGITNWSTVSGGTNATTDTYSTATLNTTTYFRAAVTNLSCPVDYSDVLPVIVNASVGGTINSSSICTSTNTTLTLNGYTGNSLLWQQSDDGTNFEQVSGGSGSTTASFTTPNLYTTRYYQVVVTNGSCLSASSSIATVTVNPVSIAGTIDGTTTLCATANSNTLTLSNYVGTIQWQSSTSISGTYTDITGETNATLLITNQTVSTYYRAVVTSGSCSAAITDNFLVTVTPTSVAGTISGATIVCASNNSTVLTLAGYTGAIQWQSSTDGSTFADIVGQTAATYTASNLTQPTYYQVNVTSGSCSMATTVPVMMDVTTSFAPYSITGTSTICVGNSTTLTTIAGCSDANSTFLWYAGGMGGDAYHQGFDAASAQFVATKSITFNNYNNGILNLTTSNTQGDPQIMMSSLGSFDPSVYKYINIRYRVTSGTADNAQIFFLNSANSNTATGGYSATGSLISDNTWRTVSIDMSSNANWTTGGNITGWRFDPAASATSCVGCSVTMDVDFIQLGTGAIVGTGSTLTVSPTSSTTYYVNRNGANISTDYIPQLVTVNALPTPTFTTQPGATACANTDVIYITEAGKSNYVWTLPGTAGIDYSITSGGTSIDNTLTVQWKTAGSKTVTINYTSGCAAPSATSSTATTVSATSVGGTATATAATVCTGTGTTITLTGYTGTIQWQQSADGTTWADVTGGSGGTTATYTTPNLTAVTYYQAVVTSGVCSEDISTMATVSINELPTTANAGADQTGAATCGLTTVTLDGNAPTVGTGTWSIVSGTGGTITTPTSRTSTFAGTAGTSYTLRWTISNSPCTASTDDVVITFNQNPTTANAGADQTGSSTCGLTIVTLAGNNPSVGTGAWSIVSGTGGTITTPSSRTSTFSGTAGSTYTLRWTISNSPCTATTDDVEITFNPAPTTANAGADQTGTPTCGLTTVTLAGNNPTVGTGAWSIVSGTGGTITTPSDRTSTFSGTAGSTYTLRWTITNNPCTASTDDVVITFNQPPTAGITNNTGTTVVTCTTPNISLTATGGTSYSWSDGTNVVGTSATLPVGSAATYTVTVTGSNGCTANSAINITENTTAPTAGITNNTATTVLTCATTSISLTATGGGNYSWSDGSTVVSSVAALSVTTPGTYTVTVTSSNGCTATSAVTITTDGSAVVPGITNNTGVTELTCTTASISLTATGGVSYSWTKSSTVVGTNATLSVTTPGTYIVTVTNSIGCSATSTITITRNITAPTAGITNNTATTVLNCTTTSISLTATGGGTYSWSNGSSVVGTSAALSVTSPATYTVTVTSSNGCTATSAVTITQNTAASTAAVLSGTATIPRGNSTNLSVAITGGTAPYTVVYTDGTSNFNVNSYTSGSNISVSPSTSTTYSLVSVTGANGCAGTGNSGTPVVTVNVGPTASVISGTTAICVGSSTNISVAITSGTSPYTVVYYNGTSNTTVNNYVSGTNISVSPTANTTYTIVSVTDANSNVGSGNNGSAVITVNTLPSITGTLTVCANATTQLSGSGTSASSNPWVSASTSIATIDNNGLVTGRALGTSIITYTNSNGCSKTAIITVSTPIAGIRNNTSTTVLTSTVTSISLTATGGSTYSWSDGSSVVSTTAAYRVTAPGTYTVTVTNANGCSSTASITITQTSTPPVSSITNNTGTTELNCTTSSISLTATGGGIYSWSNGTSVVGTSAGLTVTAPGTYTVTVTNGGSTSTSSITITQNVVTSATAVLTGSTTITSGKSANLQAAISIGNAPYTVVISDGISQFTTYSYYSGPNIVVTPSATKTYTLVTVIGANGCVVTSLSGSATVTINGGGTSKVWTGAAGDDLWSTDGNWSPAGTPASNDFITIPLGTPQLDVYFTVTGSLTVNGTGTLTVNAEKSIDIGAEGVVNFGKRDITFKSSATGTAQLGKIEGTLSNADSVIVERYFPAGRRAYRFISASVTTPSSIRYNWMENATPVFTYTTIYNTLSQYNPKLGYGTHITGLGANASGFDRTQLNTSTIYTLNTTTQAWVALGSTAGTLAAGDAYRILIRGDRSTNLNNNNATAAATTIRTKGAPKVGLHTVSSSLSTTADGWSLVGNPYQALVDLRGVSTNNLTPYYSIWDPQRGTRGAYVSYHLGTGIKSNVASDVNELVQPGQAFFVQTLNNGAATLTFDESNKAPLGTHTRVFRPMVSYPVLNVALIYTDSLANGAPEMDAFAVVFDNNFSNSVDKEDGQKNYNQDDNMGISRDGKLLAMELRDMYNATTVIPMNMVNYVRQNYTLRMNWSNPIDAGYEAYLKDNYTGATQTISFSSNTDYVFMVNSSIAASKATDRFSILFLPSSALPVSGLELNGTAERKQVKLQFEAINEKEMIGYAIERSADGIRFEQIGDQPAVNVTTGANRLYGYTDKQPVIGNNYYRIKGTSLDGQVQYSNTKLIKFGNTMPTVTVAPNPAGNDKIKLKVAQLLKGSYTLTVTDALGRVFCQKELVYDGVSGMMELKFPSIAKSGSYYVKIDGEGGSFTEAFIIQ